MCIRDRSCTFSVWHIFAMLRTATSLFQPLSTCTASTRRPSPVSYTHLTGNEELDRVLGGGLVPGSAILIGGDPGIGKRCV